MINCPSDTSSVVICHPVDVKQRITLVWSLTVNLHIFPMPCRLEVRSFFMACFMHECSARGMLYIHGNPGRDEEPTVMTLQFGVASHKVKYGNATGQSELQFTVKVTGRSEIRTPDLLCRQTLSPLTNCFGLDRFSDQLAIHPEEKTTVLFSLYVEFGF